jgi:hypothetical protein
MYRRDGAKKYMILLTRAIHTYSYGNNIIATTYCTINISAYKWYINVALLGYVILFKNLTIFYIWK